MFDWLIRPVNTEFTEIVTQLLELDVFDIKFSNGEYLNLTYNNKKWDESRLYVYISLYNNNFTIINSKYSIEYITFSESEKKYMIPFIVKSFARSEVNKKNVLNKKKEEALEILRNWLVQEKQKRA